MKSGFLWVYFKQMYEKYSLGKKKCHCNFVGFAAIKEKTANSSDDFSWCSWEVELC